MAIRSWLLVGAACFAMAAASGCCCIDACGPIVGCGIDDGGCGSCGDCTSYAGLGGCSCDICGDEYGGGFGATAYDSCGGYVGWGPGPVLRLLWFIRQSLACGVGCGGVYWGEWIGDPPACQDPCGPGYGVGIGWGACGCEPTCGCGLTGSPGCGGEILSHTECNGNCGCASNPQQRYSSAPERRWESPGYTQACPDGNCHHRGMPVVSENAPQKLPFANPAVHVGHHAKAGNY